MFLFLVFFFFVLLYIVLLLILFVFVDNHVDNAGSERASLASFGETLGD